LQLQTQIREPNRKTASERERKEPAYHQNATNYFKSSEEIRTFFFTHQLQVMTFAESESLLNCDVSVTEIPLLLQGETLESLASYAVRNIQIYHT
jgi:hypothetical protein